LSVANLEGVGGLMAVEPTLQNRPPVLWGAKVTQHWFRHWLATLMVRKDPRAGMEQGGWLDIRSLLAYAHDVPEYRRQVVFGIDDLARLSPPLIKR
jgi:hypothetical protein